MIHNNRILITAYWSMRSSTDKARIIDWTQNLEVILYCSLSQEGLIFFFFEIVCKIRENCLRPGKTLTGLQIRSKLVTNSVGNRLRYNIPDFRRSGFQHGLHNGSCQHQHGLPACKDNHEITIGAQRMAVPSTNYDGCSQNHEHGGMNAFEKKRKADKVTCAELCVM